MTLIEQIHAGPARLVVAVTGGGSGAISELLTTPGASRSVLEAVVPYAPESFAEWLGATPEQYCSEPTGRAMAMTAFLRAQALLRGREAPGQPAGVGVTASLATDRPKRGEHRAHAALQTAAATTSVTLRLEKGRRDRAAEEELVASLALNLAAEAAGIADRLPMELGSADQITTARKEAPAAWRDLLAGRAKKVLAASSAADLKTRPSPLIFPGAFHPIHHGHRRMAEVAGSLVGGGLDFEMSIVNVDKPPLDFLEIDARAAQFDAGERLWLTRAPTFVEKATLFPGATFVVGADTITRIAAPRYYGGDEAAVDEAIRTIAAQCCRFLVFGRKVDGQFRTLADLNLPKALGSLCQDVPKSAFHEDISSTELRRAERGDPRS